MFGIIEMPEGVRPHKVLQQIDEDVFPIGFAKLIREDSLQRLTNFDSRQELLSLLKGYNVTDCSYLVEILPE